MMETTYKGNPSVIYYYATSPKVEVMCKDPEELSSVNWIKRDLLLVNPNLHDSRKLLI